MQGVRTTHLDREVDAKFFESVGPLRGLKGSLYEGGVRVPLIVRWPGRIDADSMSERVTGFEDWLPTVLELSGADGYGIAAPATDGISIAPTLLAGASDAEPERPFLYREFSGYGGQQALWLGHWKGIRRDMLKPDNPRPLEIELYDLDLDLGEAHDVAAEHPDVVERIAAILKREHEASALFPIPVIDGN